MIVKYSETGEIEDNKLVKSREYESGNERKQRKRATVKTNIDNKKVRQDEDRGHECMRVRKEGRWR